MMTRFSTKILDQAVKIRRGTLKLDDVPKKDRDEVQRAFRSDSAVMTHLRLQRPASEHDACTPKPHVRGV